MNVHKKARGNNMNINKYEVLIRTVDLSSLTKAAESLNLTQSAVSHIIAGLEEDFGFQLLIRSRSGTKLTSDGEMLIPYIRKILIINEQLERTASAIRGLDAGMIRIGTFSSVAVHWLPSVIKEFQLKYPKIEIKLYNGDYHDVNKWLADGSVDLGFITLPSVLDCEAVPLFEDRLMAVIPCDHRLANADRFPIKEMESETFISLLEDSDNDSRKALELVGIKPNIKFNTKDDYAIIAMVEKGLGVSIMPELLLEGHHDGVKILELTPPASRMIAIAYPLSSHPGNAVQCFADYVYKWVKRNYDI